MMKYDGPRFKSLVGLVSAAFTAGIRNALTKSELAKVVRLNKLEKPDGRGGRVCHTHDHVDANMVMWAAVVKATGREPDLDSDADVEMINRAWDASIKKKFAV